MKHILLAATLGLTLAGVTGTALADATPDAALREEGRILFTQKAVPACAICHTLKEAESVGAIGPDLDELKPDYERILQAMQSGLGVMPSFADTLTDEQMKAIATYVLFATGGTE